MTLAASAGHETVPVARSLGVDLETGNGLADALRGADVAIEVANVGSFDGDVVQKFWRAAMTNLVAAAKEVALPRIVSLSIVGSDIVDFPYYFGKRVQEQILRESGLDVTILRATQFFEFPEPMLAAPGDVVRIPDMRSQPVAGDAVAAELLKLAEHRPDESLVQLAGPQEFMMTEVAQRISDARGLHK